MVQIMPNILEQEDFVKGLPDEYLYKEAEQPSGQLPAYLVISEIQRRTDMRERYTANQEQQPDTTIAQQIVTEGLGGMGPVSPQDNSSMLPTDMAPQTMGSPIPTDQTFQPLPAGVAAGGPPPLTGGMALGSFGLGGMGGQPQGMSSGGIVGMQQAGRVPNNYRDFAVGQSIIKLRGEDLSNFTLEEVEEIGRTGDSPFPWYSRFASDDHMGWKAFGPYTSELRSPESQFGGLPPPPLSLGELGDDVKPYDPTVSLSDRFAGTEIPFGPQNQVAQELIDEQSISGRRRSDMDEMGNDPDLFPAHFAQRNSEGVIDDWDALTGPYRATQIAKEKAIYAALATQRTAEAAGEAVVDIGQALVTPYTPDPTARQEQRDVAREGSKGFFRGIASGAKDVYGEIVDKASSLYDEYEAAGQRRAADAEYDELMSEYLMQEGVPSGAGYGEIVDKTSSLYDEYAEEGVGDRVHYLAQAAERLWNSAVTNERTGWFDQFADLLGYDAEVSGRTDDDADAVITDGGTTLSRLPDARTRAGTLVTDVGGTTIGEGAQVTDGGGYVNALIEDHRRRSDEADELAVRAQEDEAEAMKDIASLISKTQDDARGDALNAWLMNVGAGVASGDMGVGLEKGAQALGDIKKDARDAVRSLDATRLSRYFEGSKAEMDRLVARASMDASFGNMLVNLIVNESRQVRSDQIMISSIFEAMGDDWNWMDKPVEQRYAEAVRLGSSSDEQYFNSQTGRLE